MVESIGQLHGSLNIQRLELDQLSGKEPAAEIIDRFVAIADPSL